MSYVQSHADPAARARAIIVVGAGHALLGVGLVLGLTYSGVITNPPILNTWDVPIEDTTPPPPLPDDPVDDATSDPVIAPTPQVDLTGSTTIETVPFDDTIPDRPVDRTPMPTPSPDPVIATPSPTPSAAFTPTPPRITNRQSGWITNDDYANIDIRRRREGTAGYTLVIGSNGRVQTCEITSSTGHDSLDAATCRLLARRARFEAAKDANGRTVVGTFSGQVTWQIPE